MYYCFSDILENISLTPSDIQFHDTLVEDDESWTIQVIYPEGTPVDVPPLLYENDALLSLETIEESADTKSCVKTVTDTKTKQARTHRADRYRCPNCEKMYNARRNLTRHINSECGKKPRFACPYCEYKNYRRNEMKKHVKRKHNVSWLGSENVMEIIKQVCVFLTQSLVVLC